ncbi:hypothetical protein E3E31_12090 [Thermococcus sp. M39]|uniref:hypothetical protein n=1 Tax=Thermococcus sp. M39 TaxID=1638262 RepID=UPI00143C78E4|nr:hypothetical protein [Thermococcus sp. M39]NJE09248.1 hypothetical protein [Thermococcus sp. M39]
MTAESTEATQYAKQHTDVVSAEEVFKELAEKMNIQNNPNIHNINRNNTEQASTSNADENQEEKERKKRRYIGKNARINAELMKEVLRELRKAHARSYQPEVVNSIERAVRILKVIIAENEDLFPNVLKRIE